MTIRLGADLSTSRQMSRTSELRLQSYSIDDCVIDRAYNEESENSRSRMRLDLPWGRARTASSDAFRFLRKEPGASTFGRPLPCTRVRFHYGFHAPGQPDRP